MSLICLYVDDQHAFAVCCSTFLSSPASSHAGSSITPFPATTRDIDVISVQPGLVNTPGHEKMDKEHYFSSWCVREKETLFC